MDVRPDKESEVSAVPYPLRSADTDKESVHHNEKFCDRKI